jgi:hypothetical protein
MEFLLPIWKYYNWHNNQFLLQGIQTLLTSLVPLKLDLLLNPGGYPHKELTSWRKSLNFAHHGAKSLTFDTTKKKLLKC